MLTATDTKAYWKRRALKAEAEAKTWRDIRAVDNSMEMALVAQNSALRTAIVEIREALDGLSQYQTSPNSPAAGRRSGGMWS